MSVQIEVYERTIKYGYLYWVKADDEAIHQELKGLGGRSVQLILNKINLGEKNVDFKNRRISVGTGVSSRLKLGAKLKVSRNGNKIMVGYK